MRDDAQVLSISYPCLQIGAVTAGGGGKHLRTITYAEYAIFNQVSKQNEHHNFIIHPPKNQPRPANTNDNSSQPCAP